MTDLVVALPLIESRPEDFQTENHLIDANYYWTKVGEATWDQLREALDSVSGPLWDNSSSSYNGLHDRVEVAAAAKLGDSLRLVEVKDLTIEVLLKGSNSAMPSARCEGCSRLATSNTNCP